MDDATKAKTIRAMNSTIEWLSNKRKDLAKSICEIDDSIIGLTKSIDFIAALPSPVISTGNKPHDPSVPSG